MCCTRADSPKQKESTIKFNNHSNNWPTDQYQKNTTCKKSSPFQFVGLKEESICAFHSNNEDDSCNKEDL